MGSADMTLHFELDGTWSTATKSCNGVWFIPADGGKDYFYPIASVTRLAPLIYQTPPSINVEQLVANATATFRQVYTAGHVASSPPADSQIVHYASCFSEVGANVRPRWVSAFATRSREPAGARRELHRAGDGRRDLVGLRGAREPGDRSTWGKPAAPCSVQHTYAHVSADAYSSSSDHHPPLGVMWTFGNAEPAPDMEAVEAWEHVHFSVIAYYQEPDGTQFAVPLPVNNGADDFWLAAESGVGARISD